MVADELLQFLRQNPTQPYNPRFLVRVKRAVKVLVEENQRLRQELEAKATPKRKRGDAA